MSPLKFEGLGPKSKSTPPIRISQKAWGIEVGARSLKAVQLGLDSKQSKVFVTAFDAVRYPTATAKPVVGLTQVSPGETPVGTALLTLLGKHSFQNEPIAVAIQEPTAFIKYCEIPPIDDRRVLDLITYEAKVQIPLPLEDVVWDFQRFLGTEADADEGQLMDLLCLAALKYQRFDDAILPFDEAGMAIDIIQLPQFALSNFAKFELSATLDAGKSVALIDFGAKSSSLVVIRGDRISRQPIACGGDAFTNALASQVGCPFPKAELLKRNLSASPVLSVGLKAMRSCFELFATEVRRALTQFGCLDDGTRVFAIGNGFRLPALAEFVRGSIGQPVMSLSQFSSFEDSLLETKALFRENLSTYPACLGLALQALGLGHSTINLVPEAQRPQRPRSSTNSSSWFGR